MFPWTPSSFEAFGKLVSVTQFKVSNFGKEFPPIFYPTTSPLCSIAVKSSTLQMCISRGKLKSFSIQFQVDQVDQVDRVDQVDQVDHVDQVDQVDKVDPIDQVHQVDQVDH